MLIFFFKKGNKRNSLEEFTLSPGLFLTSPLLPPHPSPHSKFPGDLNSGDAVAMVAVHLRVGGGKGGCGQREGERKQNRTNSRPRAGVGGVEGVADLPV